MSENKDLGIVQPIADGIQWLGEKFVEGAGKAFGGLLALASAAIPGVGGAIAEASAMMSKSRGDNPMNEGHRIEIASHAQVAEHGMGKQHTKHISLAAISASLSDELKEQASAAVAVLAQVPNVAKHMYDTAQQADRAVVLGTNAEHGVAVAGPAQSRGGSIQI